MINDNQHTAQSFHQSWGPWHVHHCPKNERFKKTRCHPLKRPAVPKQAWPKTQVSDTERKSPNRSHFQAPPLEPPKVMSDDLLHASRTFICNFIRTSLCNEPIFTLQDSRHTRQYILNNFLSQEYSYALVEVVNFEHQQN